MRIPWVFALAAAALVPLGASARIQSTAATRTVFVSVSDAAGRPITDLTAKDFAVRVDGLDRQVVSVQGVTQPLALALLFDTTTTEIPDLRGTVEALTSDLAKSGTPVRIGVTLPQTPAVKFRDVKAGPAELLREVTQLFGMSFDVLPGIVEASRSLSLEQTTRRAMLAVVSVDLASVRAASTETPKSLDRMVNALRDTGTMFWGIQLVSSTGSRGTTMLELFMNQVPPVTGGSTERISTRNAIEPIALRFARLMQSQYALSYAEDSRTVRQLRVGVKRSGVKVYAPGWAQ